MHSLSSRPHPRTGRHRALPAYAPAFYFDHFSVILAGRGGRRVRSMFRPFPSSATVPAASDPHRALAPAAPRTHTQAPRACVVCRSARGEVSDQE